MREREKERERERDRETDRQKGGETEREGEQDRDRESTRESKRERERQRERETDRQTDRQTDRKTDRQTDRMNAKLLTPIPDEYLQHISHGLALQFLLSASRQGHRTKTTTTAADLTPSLTCSCCALQNRTEKNSHLYKTNRQCNQPGITSFLCLHCLNILTKMCIM